MSRRTLAALAIPAALILPVAVPGVAEAAPAATVVATAPAKPALTAAQRAHLHRLHVLHLRTLHNLHVWHLKTLANQRAAKSGTAGKRARVLAEARSYIGTPYRYGGSTRRGLDCSALTMKSYAVVGKHLPRSAAAQGRVGRWTAHPRVGDLVVWRYSNGVAYHVGIYAGRGRAILARHTGTRVQYQALNWGHPTYRAILA